MCLSLGATHPWVTPIRQSARAHRFRVPYLRSELRADVRWQSRQIWITTLRDSRARTTHLQVTLEFSGSIGTAHTMLHLLTQRLTEVLPSPRALGISP